MKLAQNEKDSKRQIKHLWKKCDRSGLSAKAARLTCISIASQVEIICLISLNL